MRASRPTFKPPETLEIDLGRRAGAAAILITWVKTAACGVEAV